MRPEDGLVEVENSFLDRVMLDPEGKEFCVLRGPEDDGVRHCPWTR